MKDRLLSIKNFLYFSCAIIAFLTWMAFFIQYQNYRHVAAELKASEQSLSDAQSLVSSVGALQKERGLTAGYLAATDPKLARAIQDSMRLSFKETDADINKIREYYLNEKNRSMGLALSLLPQKRQSVLEHEIRSPIIFDWYTSMISNVIFSTQKGLRDGASNGLTNVRVSHFLFLIRANEYLAHVRGIVFRSLAGGKFSTDDLKAILRYRDLYIEKVETFKEFSPPAVAVAAQNVFELSQIQYMLKLVDQIETTGKIDHLTMPPLEWWEQSSEGVAALRAFVLSESHRVVQDCLERSDDIRSQMRQTLLLLVVFGLVILGLLVSITLRISGGMNALLEGMERVIRGKDFKYRITVGRRDEFGVLSEGFNRLIGLAEGVLQEHERTSKTDVLTQLLNRRGLDEQLSSRLNPKRVTGLPLVALVLDIDHFKKVNDTFGHGAGDMVLKALADVMRLAVRPDDVAARLGGEEFVLILPSCTQRDGLKVAELLRERVARYKFPISQSVTVSIGVAESLPGEAPTDLIQRADEALYVAKSSGRNRVEAAAMPLSRVV